MFLNTFKGSNTLETKKKIKEVREILSAISISVFLLLNGCGDNTNNKEVTDNKSNEKIKELEDTISELEERNKSLTNTIDSLTSEIDSLQKTIKEKNDTIIKNEEIINSLQKIIDSNDIKINSLKDIVNKKSFLLKDQESKITNILNEKDILSKTYIESKNDYNSILEKYTNLFNSFNKTKDLLANLTNESDLNNTKFLDLKESYNVLLDKFISTNNDKTILESKILNLDNVTKKIISDLNISRSEILSLKESKKQDSEHILELNKKITDLRVVIDDNENANIELKINYQNEIDNIKNNLDVKNDIIDKLENNILILEKKLDESSKINDGLALGLKTTNKETNDLIISLKDKIKSLKNIIDINGEKYNDTVKELNKVDGLLEVSNINLVEKEDKIEKIENELSELNKKYNELSNENKKLKEIIDSKLAIIKSLEDENSAIGISYNNLIIVNNNLVDEIKNKSEEIEEKNRLLKEKSDEIKNKSEEIEEKNRLLLLQNKPKINELKFENKLILVGFPYGLTYTSDNSNIKNYIGSGGELGFNKINEPITLYIGELKLGTLNKNKIFNIDGNIRNKIYLTNFIKDSTGKSIQTAAGLYPDVLILEKILSTITNYNSDQNYSYGIVDDFVINYLNNHIDDLFNNLGLDVNIDQRSIFDRGLFINPEKIEIVDNFLGNMILELNSIYVEKKLNLISLKKAEVKIISDLSSN